MAPSRHNRLLKASVPVWVALLTVLLHATSTEGAIKSPPFMVRQQPANEEKLFQVVTRRHEHHKPFIIECEAEGEPEPVYRWEKNGKPFEWQAYAMRMSQQPGRGTLLITEPGDEDPGQYQCFATNEKGTATSNTVFVRKSELNSFKTEDPLTMEVEEGHPSKLSCQPPDGYPPPGVYWMIQDDYLGSLRSVNSSRMTVDPEGSLWFSNVTRYDESNDFKYVCSVTSDFRNEYKIGNKVSLKVASSGQTVVQTKHQPTQQFVSRKNTFVLKGQEIRLWCIYGGTPLPEITWNKIDGVIPQDRVSYFNYGKTLAIEFADFDDAGSYECTSSNGVGVAQSYSMTVKVNAIPYFTKEPETQNKAEGETVTFECEAEGLPEPKIRWIYNGMKIENAPPNPRREISANQIVIYNLTKADTGNYGCNASNEFGYVYSDVYVNVLVLPPEIRTPPSEVETVDGKEVSMTCRVFGVPKPRITWLRNGNELTGGKYKTSEEGDLLIDEVAFTDSGKYTCLAENKLGKKQAEGSLVVKEKTKITDEPQDYEVAAGQTATFRCNAVNDLDLELEIIWLTYGEEIDFQQEPRFVQQSDFSLSITKTNELDSGVYTCVARTRLDEVRSQATLIVQDEPNPPQLIGVDCGDRDALVKWQSMGDNRAPILAFDIQYNTTFTPDTWEIAFRGVPASQTTFHVEMNPWANYTFRVIARNKIGPSPASGHSNVCRTPPDVPFKNPDGVKGRGSTPDNLVIKWSQMPEIDHNGPGFKYRIYWKRQDVEGAKWNTQEITDWEVDHLVVDNQPTLKPYKIKVEAHNDRGQAHVAAAEVLGWSGKDRLMVAVRSILKPSSSSFTSEGSLAVQRCQSVAASIIIQLLGDASSTDGFIGTRLFCYPGFLRTLFYECFGRSIQAGSYLACAVDNYCKEHGGQSLTEPRFPLTSTTPNRTKGLLEWFQSFFLHLAHWPSTEFGSPPG